MQARYERNVPALSGEECLRLHEKRVLVAGCGGLGGYIIEMLARIGVGGIVCVDGDVFDESNLNRQLLCTADTLGKSKAAAAKERALRINPGADVRAHQVFIDGDNASGLIAGCNAVIDALDSISARKMLAGACAEAGIPLVFGAIRGWVAQAAVSMPGDGLMDRLYSENAAVTDRSVLSFTPPFCAAVQVSLCTKLLCGRPVETGRLYYFDLLDMECESLPLL